MYTKPGACLQLICRMGVGVSDMSSSLDLAKVAFGN